ncbi:hypothetical protein N7462_004495 [Penicillium macrosclerotiorum]|uniref:uncharacterized protein n=1 Tax=Penicillium macrosclerotiorum TaxID=303699 RepID=UPI00254916EC|nr:uncharacterized protein N7462_004495 [Penicillium macrosclerotiorum]KAJ5690103.1 hypothetical protein N7462_004495 [Penicillium macrosclerotiorum]
MAHENDYDESCVEDTGLGSYSYMCTRRWPEMPHDAPQSIDEAVARIDQMYESGIPFFTKDAIRSAFEQCQQEPASGKKIYLPGLDGAIVEFDTWTGESRPGTSMDGDEVKLDRLLLAPSLRYECRASLKHSLWWGSHVDCPPFCSLLLAHPSISMRSGTKELYEPRPRPVRADVAKAFEGHAQKWRESEMCLKLEQILTKAAAAHEITKVVGLALGTISYMDNEYPRSAVQHALLLTLRDWLTAKGGRADQDVPCFAQDPIYKSMDKAILREHGVEVVNDPRAWLEIDDTSIVFSCAPDVPVKEIVADIARPAVVIWEQVDHEDADQKGGESRTDPSSPRVRAMMEGYAMFDFDADDTHFCNTVVYVRRCRE